MACGSESAIPNEQVHADTAQACRMAFDRHLQEESMLTVPPAAAHMSVSFERPEHNTAVVTAQTTVTDTAMRNRTVRYRCRATHRHGGSGMAGAHNYDATIESAETLGSPE